MVVPQSLTPLQLLAISQPLISGESLGVNVSSDENDIGLHRNLTKQQQPSEKSLPPIRTEAPVEEDVNIIKSDKKSSVLGLLRYATRFDHGLQVAGCLASIVAGAMTVRTIP